jgi:Phage portal protein, SPP1 Gp6-like.
LSEVNLGIALPDGMQGLEIGCAWGANAVDVMAARSVFDGYVGENGESNDLMNKIVAENNLIAEYHKACRDELKFGCTFATLSGNDKGTCTIRFHSPQTAAAKWDGVKGRIAYGMAIVAVNYDPDGLAYPTVINLYTDNAIWVLTLNETTNVWHAIGHLHKMGRPLMEPLVWNATSKKPLGRSRLKKPVRELIKSYVRTVANATIGLEFATSPQKYLLGVTDEQYDAVVDSKFKQYVGSILAATTNPDNGEKPSFGQLSQGNIQPHVEMLRILSTQFSAATGLSVSDTGVVNDANPTSSEAITAQTKTLVGKAEELNDGNGQSLRIIALMAQAIALNKTLDELDETQTAVVAHFKNPAMPNIATTTDAAIKISSVRQGFCRKTDIFLEMVGFDQADIRRIKAQEAKGARP